MGGGERVQPLPCRAYDASLSWAREALYVNPNHLQALSIRAAALAQSDAPRKRPAQPESCSTLSDLYGRTALRNFHWKMAADIAHTVTA